MLHCAPPFIRAFAVGACVGFCFFAAAQSAVSAQTVDLPFAATLPADDANQIADDVITDDQLAAVKAFERERIEAIERVIGSVVAIYDEDRQGGGSGVIIDPSGIALTNHHVIIGSGITGWGGLADGKLYRWQLIGTDPGGDVSIIQLKPKQAGKPFPYTPLGDSDTARVGDWALAMGNPFILTEDQKPTVTLGIVSGVKRYQPGAGNNQLVYGNCIQVDSSINPGNSGGPLFNMNGRVIGINGRGSFKDRGRVNVGLGYAISANQITNFIPDLLATKLVEHATLDIQFADRDGKVVCSRRNQDSPAAQAGIELEDELVSFEGTTIQNANQFTNLICTLPEGWPIELTIRKKDGREKSIVTRALGLPYRKPPQPRPVPDPTPEERKLIARQLAMVKLLSAKPGTVRNSQANQRYASAVMAQAREQILASRTKARLTQLESDGSIQGTAPYRIKGNISGLDQTVGNFSLTVAPNSDFQMRWSMGGKTSVLISTSDSLTLDSGLGPEPIGVSDALGTAFGMYAFGICEFLRDQPVQFFGTPLIDGSGKVDNQNAWRIRWQTDSGQAVFGWLQMYDEAGLPSPRLRKLSVDRDCTRGGLLFDRPQMLSGVLLPIKSQWVAGLAERPVLQIEVESISRARAERKPTEVPE